MMKNIPEGCKANGDIMRDGNKTMLSKEVTSDST
jgi:hypothetical protein